MNEVRAVRADASGAVIGESEEVPVRAEGRDFDLVANYAEFAQECAL